MNYVKAPIVNSRSQLMKQRKEEFLRQNDETYYKINQDKDGNFKEYPNPIQRITERDAAVKGALMARDSEWMKHRGLSRTKTQTQIQSSRRQQDTLDRMKKFGEQCVGIHGQELPKYSEFAESKLYWKAHTNYNASPEYTSQIKMTQSRKFWGKPDELVLKDTDNKRIPPIDPFKAHR